MTQPARKAPAHLASSIVLGGDAGDTTGPISSNRFANGASQNVGNCITERSSTRLHHAPGGASSLSLAHGAADEPKAPIPRAEGKQTSSNSFATGANQNAGNVLTDRSTTRLHQAPGGTSSLSLAHGQDDVRQAKVSSNTFANGANQNAGNSITEKPTTRLHQAPGGYSSLSLSHMAGDETPVSSNRFAQGASQNVGNVITDRSSTRLHYAPGGASTLILGDENSNSSNVPSNNSKPQSGHRITAASAIVG